MYTLADTRKLYYKNVSNVITNWIDSIFVEIYYVLWAFPAIVPVWICLLIMNTNFLLLCFRIKRNDKMFGFFYSCRKNLLTHHNQYSFWIRWQWRPNSFGMKTDRFNNEWKFAARTNSSLMCCLEVGNFDFKSFDMHVQSSEIDGKKMLLNTNRSACCSFVM